MSNHPVPATLARLGLPWLALLSFGCIATDYGAIDPPLNKTTAVIGCASGSVFNTTVQTIVPQTQQLLYNRRLPNGDADCSGVATPQRVSRQDAMDWNFCVAAFAPITEWVEFGGPRDGTWINAGVMDMPDGSVRINNWHAPGVYFPASCVRSGLDPSGPESSIIGDGFAEAPRPPRLPGLRVEAVAIDRDPGANCGLCRNVVAVHPAYQSGFSTYYCTPRRANENRVRFTPQCRQEGGLVPALSGQPITIEIQDVQITGRARLDDTGHVIAELLALEAAGVRYDAKVPVWFRLDPRLGASRIEMSPSVEEERRLARFAIDAGLVDRPLELGGMTEYGVMLPEVTILISSTTLQAFLDGRLYASQ